MLVAAKGLANGQYMTSYRLDFANSQRHRQTHEPLYGFPREEPPARSHGRSFRMPVGEQCARVCIQLTGTLSTLHVLCNCIAFCYVVWRSPCSFSRSMWPKRAWAYDLLASGIASDHILTPTTGEHAWIRILRLIVAFPLSRDRVIIFNN